ncbi:hypothetical protein [Mycobacterium sp. 3519A]|uniref:hypothetical protein n=1 Tax=Mycobacterium sp. 3519A TaxID=2057184 RepID=UPI000C79F664|nr:hypothetical protein [Mycobacterium sp. 3519A]
MMGTILGGFAVAAFATLSVITTHHADAMDQAAGSGGNVTAATQKPSAPPHSPPIPFAKPAITGPAKLPPEEQGLPGD